MILKNPEAFRSWLIRQLEPICKANPEPVSKYVCALLKKEKNDGELKNNLISHLYIFLHSATEEFVNFLIDALEDDKYETSETDFKLAELLESTPQLDDNKVLDEHNDKSISKTTAEPSKMSTSPARETIPSPSALQQVPSRKLSSPQPKRSRFRSEKRSGQVRKSRRDFSRSNSPARRKRNASGSSETSNESPRRSWFASRLSDSRQYKHGNTSRSPLAYTERSISSKLRRHGKASNFRKRSRVESHVNADEKRADVNDRLPYEINVREIPLLNHDLHQVEQVFESKQRCSDFEGQGFCARGDTCPFDHGPAPIVLNDSILHSYGPLPHVHGGGFQNSGLYHNFSNPHNFPRKSFRPDAPIIGNRELISVPTVPLSQMNNPLNSKPSYGHIFSSLPPGVSQTTIELTNVPGEKNNIPDLYENFSKFGKITLVQEKRNRDENVALLTYSNATEAALAFTNVRTAMCDVRAAWYADKCILKPFPLKSIPASHKQSLANSFTLKRSASVNSNVISMKKTALVGSPRLETANTVAEQKDADNRQPDPEILLCNLIKKKKELLMKQFKSRKQVVQKIKSLEAGSEEERTWNDVLQKLKDVISENQKSFRESLKQRKEYLQKMNIVPIDLKNQNVVRQKETQNDKSSDAPSAAEKDENTKSEEISEFRKADKRDQCEQSGKILDKEIDNTITPTNIISENREPTEEAVQEGKTF